MYSLPSTNTPVRPGGSLFRFTGLNCGVVYFLAQTICVVAVAAPPPKLGTSKKTISINHDGISSTQVFPAQAWRITAPQSRYGATVIWESAPFRHSDDRSLEADVSLQVNVTRSNGRANWTAIQPHDQSDIDRNDREAVVVVRSRDRGNGSVDLTVSFIESTNSIAAVGEYQAVVFATITEN